MTIGGVGTSGIQAVNNGMQQAAGINTAEDSVSRNIQKQIENEQKKLQDLASDEKMTPEEKMKKRQEIQQEIASLTQQLRQHQMKVKREQQQSKASSMENTTGGSNKSAEAKSEESSVGLSQEGMQALISANASVKQAGVHGNVSSKLKGEANVLESEIKTDASRGGGSSVAKKQQELAETEGRAQAAAVSQAYSLGKANAVVSEASKAEQADRPGDVQKTDKEDNSKNKSDKISTGKGGTEAVSQDKEEQAAGGVETDEDMVTSSKDAVDAAKQTAELQRQTVYTSVDIRL